MMDRADEQAAKGLVGRGSAMLALAATAHARGHRAVVDKWHVLSPQMKASAEQVLHVIEKGVSPELLTAAIQRAMSGEPITAVPKWAVPITNHPEVLSVIAADLPDDLVAPALPGNAAEVDAHTRGLAALAVSLCRSRDTLTAIAATLPKADRNGVLRMSRLAQATVASGEPSRIRGELKRRLKDR